MRRSVVDVGSNSVLLTVGENDGNGWQSVFESSRVTGLGEGTKATGLLSEAGISRTLDALRDAFRDAEKQGSAPPVAAATMAARIARNSEEFLQRAMSQGTPVTVLSGDEEAELGFQAVASDPIFAQFSRLSIVDPGGQSTELVTAERSGESWNIAFRRSYPVGTLGMRGDLLASESPEPMEILRAASWIDDLIGLVYRPDEAGRVVVLGATGTNLITIRERMREWNSTLVHGAWLDYEEVSKAVGWMMRMTDSERAAIVGIEPGRERTIHIGSLILERFLHALKVLGCSVSVRGWRHALLERG